MYIIKTEESFDAAHFLAGYNGKCRNLHGHRWRVIAKICSEELKENGQLRGMVEDFGDIRHDLKLLADGFDHSLIFEQGTLKEKTVEALTEEEFRLVEVPFRPTAENFARHFFDLLAKKGYRMHSVEVYETPGNCAIYTDGRWLPQEYGV